MEYITYVDINGVRGDIPVNQVGNGAPTTSTVGAVGQFYMDKSTEEYTIYKCVNDHNGVYTWVPFAVSGGEVSGDYISLSGHTPNQMMATDANGDFVLMEIPSGGGSSGDSPVTLIENTDSSNRVPLRSLSSGTYVLKGYFTAYEGSTASYTFSTGMLVAVVVTGGITYVQIFYPKNNTIQYLEISDDSVTRQDAKLINMESIANMVTQVNEASDDSHYPSARAVYEAISDALSNVSGGITEESDPTVPAWAKASSKPTYTASEVGALPSDTKIPEKTSDLTNDSGFITGYTETDPTVPAWAKASSKPTYSKSEVGLGNVDNVKQYSASNPPPYPVTSVNGKSGAVSLGASDVGAATKEQFEQVSAQIADCETLTLGYGTDGKLYIYKNKKPIGTGIGVASDETVSGTINEDNNLIFNDNIADGDYTLYFLSANNVYSDAMNMVVSEIVEVEEIEIDNLIPTLVDTDLVTIYNGKGYKEGVRISISAGGETTATAVLLTGLIPLGNDGDVFHIRGVSNITSDNVSATYQGGYWCYSADGALLNTVSGIPAIPTSCIGYDENGDFTITMNHSAFSLLSGTAYIRFQFGLSTGEVIMTRNKLISSTDADTGIDEDV